MSKPDDVGVGTALMVLNDQNQILLHLRKGAHRAGCWSCPGGWLDRSDTSTSIAAIREAKEEVGIEARRAEPLCWLTEDHPSLGVRTVTLYHVCSPENWSGEPQVLEPTKCERLEWFDLEDLPSPLFPGLQKAVEQLQEAQERELLLSECMQSLKTSQYICEALGGLGGDSMVEALQPVQARLDTLLARIPPLAENPGTH